jgi:transaldolase
MMKFFVDTANLDEIRQAGEMGLIDGVTTNPSLVAKEGKIDFREHIAKICEMVDGDVSVEVTSLDAEGMLREGREFAKIAPNVVIKCPLTLDGLKATRTFRAEGTKVNVTLCFSAAQALLAAKAGATYISPFIGRLDDIAQDGMQLIRDIVQIYDNYGFATEVLAARPPPDAHRGLRSGGRRRGDDPLQGDSATRQTPAYRQRLGRLFKRLEKRRVLRAPFEE